MPGDKLTGDTAGRRAFLRAAGGTALGSVVSLATLGWLAGCGGDESPPTTSPDYGRITGVVVDRAGTPQPSLGRIFLLDGSGRMTGRTADVGPDGKFAFADVAPGEWQLRFHAPRIAYVYEVEGGGTGENPTRIVVTANGTATALFPVIRGELNEMEIEIYVGDNFFYEVPFGSEGGTATVKVGTTVCWYNVGVRVHNVTGGPWVTSGDLQKTGAFIWTADRPGTFPYRCTHHEPQMTATLVVTA